MQRNNPSPQAVDFQAQYRFKLMNLIYQKWPYYTPDTGVVVVEDFTASTKADLLSDIVNGVATKESILEVLNDYEKVVSEFRDNFEQVKQSGMDAITLATLQLTLNNMNADIQALRVDVDRYLGIEVTNQQRNSTRAIFEATLAASSPVPPLPPKPVHPLLGVNGSEYVAPPLPPKPAQASVVEAGVTTTVDVIELSNKIKQIYGQLLALRKGCVNTYLENRKTIMGKQVAKSLLSHFNKTTDDKTNSFNGEIDAIVGNGHIADVQQSLKALRECYYQALLKLALETKIYIKHTDTSWTLGSLKAHLWAFVTKVRGMSMSLPDGNASFGVIKNHFDRVNAVTPLASTDDERVLKAAEAEIKTMVQPVQSTTKPDVSSSNQGLRH